MCFCTHLFGKKREQQGKAPLWEQTGMLSSWKPGAAAGGEARGGGRRAGVGARLVFRAQGAGVSEHHGKPLASCKQGSLMKRKEKMEKGR